MPAKKKQDSEDPDTEAMNKSESGSSKAKTNKRKATSTSSRPAAKGGKKVKAVVVEQDDGEEDEDEDEEAEDEGEDEDEDESMEEIAPLPAPKKGAAGKKGAGGRSMNASGLLSEQGDESSSIASAREKKLQKKLDLTTASLEAVQTAFEQLRELRTTRPEESEKALIDIASERQSVALQTIQTYKTENDNLRSEIADLRHSLNAHSTSNVSATSSSSTRATPLPSSELASRLAKLEKINSDLARENKELRDAKDRKEVEEKRKIAERDQKWEKELARTVEAKDKEAATKLKDLKAQLDTATRDLAAEIELSKSIQTKAKNGSAAHPTSSSTPLSTVKLQEELLDVKSKFELLEDLTSLCVLSVKRDDEGSTYNCLLHATSEKKDNPALSFKLTFHPDGFVTYVPTLDEERDDGLMKLLAADQSVRIRFNALQTSQFFRRLFVSMNKLKKA